MKKTLTINLNGRVFTIDEDAYELLDNYLRNLRIYFRKNEGSAEIIADFEARIEELFSERVRLGHEVITIEQVETIIKQVGKPEDFGDDAENAESEIIGKEKKDGGSHPFSKEKKVGKKLYRDVDHKMLGGVVSGFAAYFGWDVTPTRLIFVCLIIAASFAYGWGIWGYLIFWIIIPAAKTAQQKLEMRGEEVTIENIGKVVAGTNTTATEKSQNKGCIGFGLNFLAALLKVFIVGTGILIGLPIVFVLIIILITISAILLGVGGGLVALPFIGHDFFNVSIAHPIIALIAAALVVAIPLFLLIYSITVYFAKLSPLPKSVKLTGLVVWIAALITLICSGIHINVEQNPDKWSGKNKGWHFRTDKAKNTIEGNQHLADKMLTLPIFDIIQLDENLVANVQLKQSATDSVQVVINGESNLIDKIDWILEENRLKLSVDNDYRLNTNCDMIIKVTTPSIKGVEINSIGSVRMPGKIQSDDFFIKIDGAGNFQADSLYCNSFNSDLQGLGNIEIAGKASKATFRLKGAGRIKAADFEANDIEARLNGIGAVNCNPLQNLDASVDGIGQITYKNEPEVKKTWVNGMGKIKKE